jgi:DNA-binding MarR family transcriptional regulator
MIARRKNVPIAEVRQQFEQLADFRYALRRFLRFSEQVSREHGVTPIQYQLMLQIRGFPGRDHATVGELAERLQALPHAMVSLLKRCEALDLVQRSRSQTDGRTVHVRLTRKGRRILHRLAPLHQAELQHLRESLLPAAKKRAT